MELTPDLLAWATDWLASPDVDDVHPVLTTHPYWMAIAVDGSTWSLLIFDTPDAETCPTTNSTVHVISADARPQMISASELLTDQRWWLRPSSDRRLHEDWWEWWEPDEFLAADAESWEGRAVSLEVEAQDEDDLEPILAEEFRWSSQLRTTATSLVADCDILTVWMNHDESSTISVSSDHDGFVWAVLGSAWMTFLGTLASLDDVGNFAREGYYQVYDHLTSYTTYIFEDALREQGGAFSSRVLNPQQMWDVVDQAISVDEFLRPDIDADEPELHISCVGFEGSLQEFVALHREA